ncbi:MAG TPA: 3-oxoacyl-[acyl-carrier-protein] synthase III C-terminal domain-containing protein [Chthoniobacteraceae bacterium]|nr:3-oxoacyl-[acyl-carrier-protein] synthase III C-terminal domain-containing protein [Chthoniobacteraceae bacterium]
MFLVGLATSVPPYRYTQQQCWEAVEASGPYASLVPAARTLFRKLLVGAKGAVATRYLSLENLSEAFALHPDALAARFERNAPRLAVDSARKALEQAGVEPREVDALLVSTCTGYLCPGLSSHVAGALGLRREVQALDLVGQGCGAALPNWRTAAQLLAGPGVQTVLSICVEITSAALYLDNDPGVLVSASLFGDGAAAAVLTARPSPRTRRVRWVTGGGVLRPEASSLLRMETRNGMLRNILAREVPALAGEAAREVVATVLKREGLSPAAIGAWIFHPGGREVLLALRRSLGLQESDLALSAAVLREYGNMSSPSVLFVLERALQCRTPGGWWWMASFGAGFSSHGALLEVAD